MTKIAVVYHSGYGHTAEVAKAVARGAAAVEGVEAKLIPVADVEKHWQDLDDAIIFGAPTYMGSVNDLNRLGGFGGSMTQSAVDRGAEAIPQSDLKTAEQLGRRVARVALQFAGERVAEPA